MVLVKSKSNKWVKYIKKLFRRRFRGRESKFVVEGIRVIEEILESDVPVEVVLFSSQVKFTPRGCELIRIAQKSGITVLEVTEKIMNELSDTETPQGILAVVHRVDVNLDEIISSSPSLLVLVDGVQDPGNLGTIIRTAAGGGVEGVILLPGTVDLYNPKTLRSTMGNIFKIPIVVARDREEVLRKLSDAGLKLIVGDPSAKKAVFEVGLTGPVIIVVGNEGNGVKEDLLKLAGNVVNIPMSPGVDSLNVAVAAGIMIYEVLRQRYS